MGENAFLEKHLCGQAVAARAAMESTVVGSRNACVGRKRSLSGSKLRLPPHTAVAGIWFPVSVSPLTQDFLLSSTPATDRLEGTLVFESGRC